MRLTERDVRLVRDLALSHVLSRDQILSLGYFSSVTRTNTRLRELRSIGQVRSLMTPFFGQHLYAAGPSASSVVGERISPILAGRTGTPRFVQHALCVTNVRIALALHGMVQWKFEQQSRSAFEYAGRRFEVRPDGLALLPNGMVAVEVDLGHVAVAKFRDKLLAYDAFVASGCCARYWRTDTLRLLTVTTGKLRASRLQRVATNGLQIYTKFSTHDDLEVQFPGSWS